MRVRELRLSYGATGVNVERPQVLMPADTLGIVRPLLDPEPVEVFGVLLLNTKHRLLAWAEISRGGLNSTIVEPREVFRPALVAGAVCLIAAHNHPSGDPMPSPHDVALTARLRTAGALLGVELLDHVIIGAETGRYYSFKEMGAL